ncbi:SH3 domain-containing protein [Arthroderma uncinatum]|uniref:SH3 domain-containing protein n=1 Tax=Arthroderma uncinatum TaxID=74035 RepID=UPI00144A86BE|nr:SH3 domain-containing protein [Arthroderma uncinatum]KAF3491310.1 SH3 domain-containing protein [Arthroderma uncinatum]
MPLGFNNPLPSSLSSECRKASKILLSFIDPAEAFGPEKVIPPEILANAKGLAILTVVKAGFVGSARFGSGVVVARLADGQWSAPSAITTAGAGFGGQLGFEFTDFVFILNDAAAVRSFSQVGSITLGGNVSVAAGPVGRNAEAAGAASLKGVAGVFSYSKTKGLFAGVSLEGSVLIERKEANARMYNAKISASQLLSGAVPPPPGAEPLMAVLRSRAFSGRYGTAHAEGMYNDVPVYDDRHAGMGFEGRNRSSSVNDYQYSDRLGRNTTWQGDVHDQQHTGLNRSNTTAARANPQETFDSMQSYGQRGGFDSRPARPTAPKPVFGQKPQLSKDQAVALFTFDADQDGDLGFKKGEIITIVKRTEKQDDWWTGKIGNRVGIFPSNYVEAGK